MKNFKTTLEKFFAVDKFSSVKQTIQAQVHLAIASPSQVFTLKNIRGGLFLLMGYLLSPLCWWNDLVFNLPIAYLLGHFCNWVYPGSFLPGAIGGYWLSNIIGILMMQLGAIDVLQSAPQGQTESEPRNLKKDLLAGVVTSTVYTLIILALVQLKVLDAPHLFDSENAMSLSFLSTLVS
jgi:hypothetical protein